MSRSRAGVPTLINVGDPEDLLRFIARHHRLDALRSAADDGSWFAANLLAHTLVSLGRLQDLRLEVDAGTVYAVEQLADALTAHGRDAEAHQLRRFGLNDDGTLGPANLILHLP